MIIQHKDIAALLLLYNGKFQVISKPNTQMEMVTTCDSTTFSFMTRVIVPCYSNL